MHRQQRGFTLLEILLVIAAIGILAAIVLVAINPNRQIAQARNAQRRVDLNTINKGLDQILIDTSSYPNTITNSYQEICATGNKSVTTPLTDAPSVDCTGRLDLRVLVPTYMAAIPRDPQSTGSSTGYYVAINSTNNKISVKGSNGELSQTLAINDTGESVGGTPAPAPPDPNISLLMNCNQSSFVDSSIYGRTISIQQGTPTLSTVQSRFGGSSCLMNATSRLGFSDAPELELTGDFTIETWAYPLNSGDNILAGHSSQNVQLFRLNSGGTGRVSYFLNGTQVFSAVPSGIAIVPNNWYHLAISRSGTTTRAFVNGIQVGSSNTTWTGTFRVNMLGLNWFGSSYTGYFDDFRITKGVSRYNTNFTPPNTELAVNDTTTPLPFTGNINTSVLMNCNQPSFVDSSIYGRSVSIQQGGPTLSSAQSRFGGASCLLNNTSRLGFADTTELELTGDFTIETWAYPLNSGDQIIAGHLSQNVQLFRLNEGGAGRLSFNLNSNQVFSSTPAGITPNNWYHLAITRAGNTTRMFVNGVQVGSNNTTWTGSFRMNILGLNWFGSFYTGHLDDFRVTKGVALYTSNFTPPTAELSN